MKRLIVFSALALLMAFGVGLNTAAAAPPIDMVGVWTGTANEVTDTETTTSTMTLEILTQEDVRFAGTMKFDDGTAFNVNGVLDKMAIRITGSVSVFEGAILGMKGKKKIHGTGSKLEGAGSTSATLIFNLMKE